MSDLDRLRAEARRTLRELAAKDLTRLMSTNPTVNPYAGNLPASVSYASHRAEIRDCLRDLEDQQQ
jgi:hypothetical protein